jgi:RNA polymerase sigma factor (sigma-70 family)
VSDFYTARETPPMSSSAATSPLSDADLTRAAQAGDAGSLGVLLARHQASIRAVALSMIGYGPDTDDVVQDAALLALRRIQDVRNPEAVGPWLRAVVRNECRMRLRARRVGDLGGEMLLALPSDDPMPEELLDRHLLQDWVWHAIGELSPSLRVVAMLRYFSDVSTYEQIASVCQLPIGTVRSRLSQVRVKFDQCIVRDSEAVARGRLRQAADMRTRHRRYTGRRQLGGPQRISRAVVAAT